MNAVSYVEASADLEAMMDEVVADGAPLAITLERSEGAVLISASEWASIEETLHPTTNAWRLLEMQRSLSRLDDIAISV